MADDLGVAVPSSNPNRNYGILLSGGVADNWANIVLDNNEVYDTRASTLLNNPIFITSAAAAKTKTRLNRWSASRNPYTESFRVETSSFFGGDASADTRLYQNAASAGLFLQIFQSAGQNAFSISKPSGDSTLDFRAYPTLGSGTTQRAFAIVRSRGQVLFDVAPRLPSTTTAGRPSASTLGAGSQIFDTTLGYTITSNGTAWVDASGVAV